jgi:hypothetical protein
MMLAERGEDVAATAEDSVIIIDDPKAIAALFTV